MTLLAARCLHVRVGAVTVCRELDLSLDAGQCWGILGANGAGKTTLLHTLAGLRRHQGGSIAVEERQLDHWPRKALATKLGVLFQDSFDAFPGTVLETALAGRFPHLPFWSMEGAEDEDKARAALTDVELEAMAARTVDTLSGGERRRLAIATVLVQAPRIWLLDEPTNHLDLRFQIGLLELLRSRALEPGGTLMMSLHDVNLVLRFCTHALLLIEGEEPVCGPVDEVVTAGNLERLYRHPVVSMRGEDGRTGFSPR